MYPCEVMGDEIIFEIDKSIALKRKSFSYKRIDLIKKGNARFRNIFSLEFLEDNAIIEAL